MELGQVFKYISQGMTALKFDSIKFKSSRIQLDLIHSELSAAAESTVVSYKLNGIDSNTYS